MSQYETQMPNNPPLPKGFTPQRSLPDSSLPAGDFTDMSYCNMILEAPIPPTADQVPWFCTCTLCKGGSTGPKGDRGDRGLPGQPGSPGRRGLTGLQGSPGFIGHPGMKGQKGDEGVKGNQGPIGLMGMKGEQGYKGDKGDLGMDGRPGVQGPPGEPGQCPASCESPPGSPGEVGLPGIVGPRGIPGNEGTPGMKGQKGDKGEVGMPGLPGLEGRKGDQGEQGLCNCKDGAKGANGSQGSMGPKGDKGDAGSQGHEGVAGLKGEKGDLGMKGPPGPCTPAIQSAFSARLAFNYPKPNLPVPFTDVIFNVQFHFDPTLGVYTAPVNGTYVFSYHLVVSLKTLKVGLFHNFQPVVKTTDSPNVGTASQHIVLHLNRFDRVWLQVKDSNTNGMFANSESSSTFSGFLLYPDNCDEPFFRDFPVFSNDETYDWGNLPNVTTPDP
ncbi:complement C1q and tumor necrosis factor-related protein 9-like [Hoplias malabaricus]|uniref:complement C1q and tumor necrosis factor-related protein 9-like n=1 Tax=Hoplias malabaricus TaxID=27720 RepID=UPI003461FEC2